MSKEMKIIMDLMNIIVDQNKFIVYLLYTLIAVTIVLAAVLALWIWQMRIASKNDQDQSNRIETLFREFEGRKK